ncbi:MAG: hypothetical protein ACYDEX_10725 [Mobilitalea sp.]
MEKENSEYTIADVSKDDISIISDLEKSLSSQKNTDIVLIAYQPNKKVKK